MISVPIPGLRLVSEANQRGHWAVRARRAKAQRNLVTLVLRGTVIGQAMLVAPLDVTITRIAPRNLDSDNLVGSAKAVRDAIAALLGVDDRDERVRWHVAGAPGPYGVHVAIEAARDTEARPGATSGQESLPAINGRTASGQ